MNSPKKIVFDSTILAINYARKSGGRTGIFFYSKALLKSFIDLNLFTLILYCEDRHRQACLDFIKDEFEYEIEVITEKDDFSEINAFFSPVFAIPDFIRNKKWISKFTVIHDVIPLAMKGYEHLLTNTWFSKLIDSINGQDTYFCNSEFTKNDVLKFVKTAKSKNIYIAYAGVLEDIYMVNNDQEKIRIRKKYNIPNKDYFLTLSSIEKRKNIKTIIKSFLIYKKKNNKNAICVFAGSILDKDFNELKKEIPEITNKNHFIFTGYVDDADRKYLYSMASIFIYTSTYEGFGMPIIEAMRCGVPVITSNTTSLSEVAGDSAITVTPESVQEHVIALERLSDMQSRDTYRKKSLERSKLFTWEESGKKISKIILQKINQNRHVFLKDYNVREYDPNIFYNYFRYRLLSKIPSQRFNKYYEKYNIIKEFIKRQKNTVHYLLGMPLVKKISIHNRYCYFFMSVPLVIVTIGNNTTRISVLGVNVYKSKVNERG